MNTVSDSSNPVVYRLTFRAIADGDFALDFSAAEGAVVYGADAGDRMLDVSVNQDVVIIGAGGRPSVGDATAATADLIVTGATLTDGYFSLDGLKTAGISHRNATVSWQNDQGTVGSTTAQGVALSDLLGYVGLKGAARSVTIVGADGLY